MIVQVELAELESLRAQVAEYKKEAYNLKVKLEELEEQRLIEKATDLSLRLFDSYMAAVFQSLGFKEPWDNGSVKFQDHLHMQLGKTWWRSDRLKVWVRAEVSEHFRCAFLNIGVIPKQEDSETTDNPFKLEPPV